MSDPLSGIDDDAVSDRGQTSGTIAESARPESALKERAMDEAPVGIVITDPALSDNPIVYANDGFTRLTGYPKTEILSRNCRFLQGEGTESAPVDRMRAAVDAGESVTVELRNYRKNGQPFLNRVTIAPLYDGDEIANFVGIQQDVSDHEQRERELEQEREFVERTLDVLNDVFYVVDPDGSLRRWNDRFSDVTGYSDDAIADMDVFEFVPDAERDRISAAIERTLTDGRGTIESALLTADGGAIPYEFAGARLTDPEGELIGLVVIGRDVSERNRRQRVFEALHEIATTIQTETSVEGACERAVAAAGDVLEFDMCTVVLQEGEWLVPYAIDAPPGGSRRMRIDQGLAGKTFQSGDPHLVDEITHDDKTDPARESYRSGISVPIGERGVFQAASNEAHAFDAQDVEFAELLVSHTANAIERIEREADLQRQNDRLEEFASIVSHDLRNPLNVAMGRLEFAREECDSDHLDDVAEAHDRMESLIENLLLLSREGESAVETERVAIAETIEDCWQNVRTKDARLEVETDRAIRANVSRLEQLGENLVRNAVEHGDDGVTITVGTVDDGFYVEDDGPGIPPEERETVFETGHTTSPDGNGFGLSIVDQICEAHGWSIRATESRDGGARFEITGVEFVR
ncbi:PAS domain-containing protein [Halosolutus amylolyticus]|uniref:histidine kinase n=1 Tax=Halosolutus amylolyticus TaxID=2932267 RepID=A0ABD5PKQ6_9EURY|nr:PAS domain-containing protein [Halosolutus amylolyticus]